MHLLKADPPICFMTIIVTISTFPISSTTFSSSPSAEDPIFSSQDLIFSNDIPSSLFLDSTNSGSSIATSGAESNEEESLMGFLPNDDFQYTADAFDADADSDIDLLSLLPPETDCQLPADAQAGIATSDLSLWTRDETTTCLNNGLRSWFPKFWFPKNPTLNNLDLGRGIRLPPPSGLLGDGESCFLPHPMHCCCDGARAFSGRTVGGLIRVMTIEECDLLLHGAPCFKRDDVCCRLLSGSTGIDCIGQY